MTDFGDWMNSYDTDNIGAILRDRDGYEYSWANAHVLRFLDKIMAKVGNDHHAALYRIYPTQMRAIYKYWGWSKTEIDKRIMELEKINESNDYLTAATLIHKTTEEREENKR